MTDHRILVPTDLTEFGTAALDYARLFRDKLGSQVTVVHADEPVYPAGMPDLAIDVIERTDEEKRLLEERVHEHVAAHLAPPVDVRVIRQFVVSAIESTADEIDASLIIMGTHGRTGWRRLLQGSIAEQVVHRVTRPLLTVGRGTAPGRSPRIETILCPVNLTAVAIEALRDAAGIAAAFDADLVIVYVSEANQPLTSEIELELSARVEPELRGRCRYRHIVRSGQAAEEVLLVAEQIEADLLVLGAQHRRLRDATVIGSTTGRIIRFAPCAVLTVIRPQEAAGSQVAAA